MIADTRLRDGDAASAQAGQPGRSLAASAIATARACGCAGTVVVRMDSAYDELAL